MAEAPPPPSPSEGGVPLSVVLALNDLEALEIWRLLDPLVDQGRLDRHRLNHPWGEYPELTGDDIARLAPRVLLVEASAPALVEQIRQTGRSVEEIDHHLSVTPDGTLADRRAALSCLEQLIDRLNLGPETLTLRRRLVAAGDRGFLPAMAQVPGVTPDMVRTLREEDLTLARLARDPLPGLDLATLDPEAEAWREQLRITRALIAEAEAYLRAEDTRGWIHRLDSRVGLSADARQPLLVARLPLRFRHVAVDAAYNWLSPHPSEALELLIILGEDPPPGSPPHARPGPSRRVEWTGPARRLAHIPHWFGGAARERAPALNRYAGGQDTLYFGAEDRLKTAPEQVEAMAELILEDIVTGARPLRQWRTTFSQSFFLGEALPAADTDTEPGTGAEGAAAGRSLKQRILDHLTAWRARAPASPLLRPTPVHPSEQERRYFMPHVRDLLVSYPGPVPETAADSDRAWATALSHAREGARLVGIDLPAGSYALRLTMPGALARPESALTLPLEGLRLTFFHGDVMVVEWTVAQTSPVPPAWGRGLLAVLEGPAEDRVATLAEAVAFNAETRFLYSSWRETDDRRLDSLPVITLLKDGQDVGRLERNREISASPITGWFSALLEEITGLGPADFEDARGDILDNAGRLRLLTDDRARIVTTLLPQGRGPTSPPGRRAMDDLMARVAQVDSHGSGPAYDAAFTRKEFETCRYDRYLDMGTVYTATSHSLALITCANPIGVTLLAPHMDSLYRRLFLIAQVYRGTLGGFSLLVAEALERGRRQGGDGAALALWYDQLHEARLRFTNHLWFHQVSTQVQGVELFDLITRQAGLDREFQLVREEIAEMRDWLTARSAVDHDRAILAEERTERQVGFIALPFGLFTAILASRELGGAFFLWPMLAHLPWLPTWAWAALLSLVLSLEIYAWVKPDRALAAWDRLLPGPSPARPPAARRRALRTTGRVVTALALGTLGALAVIGGLLFS